MLGKGKGSICNKTVKIIKKRNDGFLTYGTTGHRDNLAHGVPPASASLERDDRAKRVPSLPHRRMVYPGCHRS